MAETTPSTAVVTGAGRGVGAAIARALGAEGWHVVLGARSAGELAAVAEAVVVAGGTATAVPTDVTSVDDVRALVETALGATGRLDAVVANAGVAFTATIADGDPADWDRMIDVNLRGVLHLMAAAVPVLRQQGSGRFVTIGSTSATTWTSTQGVYAATKAGARAVTEVLRRELAPDGIGVTFVSPGMIDTGFIESTRDPERLAALRARRDELAMPPEAVADAVVYAVTRPASVDVGELTIRPTAQP